MAELTELTIEELDALAIQEKEAEIAERAARRATKIAVRDELARRANISYAEQRLNGVGITVTPETLKLVMEGH